MMSMPTHVLLGLWNACKKVKEEEAEEQKKQQNKSGAGNMAAPNMSSMMSGAKNMMPKMPNMPTSIRMPGAR